MNNNVEEKEANAMALGLVEVIASQVLGILLRAERRRGETGSYY